MAVSLVKAFTGSDADCEAAVDRAVLRMAVSRAVVCRRSGVVLDVRTAVRVTFRKGTTWRSMVLDGAEWDAVSEKLLGEAAERGITAEIIDGRKLR